MQLIPDSPFWAGVLSSMVATLVLGITARALKLRMPRPSAWYWRRITDDAHVFVTQIPGKYDVELKVGSQPHLTPIGDAIAFAELLNFLRHKLGREVTLSYLHNDADWNRVKAKNIIVIGGPKYNVACMNLLLELDSRVDFQFARLRVPKSQWKKSDVSLKRFVPRDATGDDTNFHVDSKQTRDFGTVLWTRNPYNHSKSVVVVAGLSTLSTIGSMEWLLRQSGWSWIPAWIKGRGWQAVISCEVIDAITVSDIRRERFARIVS